jgi:proteic killer suppression protein
MIKVKMSIQLEKYISRNKIPKDILKRLEIWIVILEKYGLYYARNIKGYRDHQLKGDRHGQRSIYLNMNWRAIYTEDNNEVVILTITPHKY